MCSTLTLKVPLVRQLGSTLATAHAPFDLRRWNAEATDGRSMIVMGAGTGGTSATIGRFIRYTDRATRLCVADVENSAFYDNYVAKRRDMTSPNGSRIEGIGRPRCEPSFISNVVDRMFRISDAASLAGMLVLSERMPYK